MNNWAKVTFAGSLLFLLGGVGSVPYFQQIVWGQIEKRIVFAEEKSKGGHLSEEEKASNKLNARDRIAVEYSLSGLTLYRVLSNRLRIKDFGHYNNILRVCDGFWNFNLSH